ncbi:glycosyl transferase [Serratia marcescens]|nr:glycosyl transferase [Serratia marcescens]
MNILMVNTLYAPYAVGGAEVSVQLLAEELVKSGHKVRVLTLHNEKKRKKELLNGVDIVYLPLANIYWPFQKKRGRISKLIWHLLDLYNPVMARKVGKEIDDFNPDVVHTNNISGFSVAVWKKIKNKKIKLVHTSRDYYLFHPNSTMFNKNGNMHTSLASVRFWSFVKRRMSRHVDTYIGISDYILKFHRDNGFFIGSEVDCIYNAVDVIEVEKRTSRDLRVGFIGRLTEDKGFDIFCSIAEKYKGDTTIKFSAAGRFNTDEEALRVRAHKSEISLLGFVPISEFLQNVDVVILPVKWREPFGRVVAESALAGKIVITNFVGGITEISELLGNIYQLKDVDMILTSRKVGMPSVDINNPFEKNQVYRCYLQYYLSGHDDDI